MTALLLRAARPLLLALPLALVPAALWAQAGGGAVLPLAPMEDDDDDAPSPPPRIPPTTAPLPGADTSPTRPAPVLPAEFANDPPPPKADDAGLAPTVDPPKAAPVERVTVDFKINGLAEPELTNAYNWLGYVAEDQREGLVPNRMKALHDAAEKSIAKALQPFGYYKPTITKRLEGGPKDYFAYYNVVRGPAVRWIASSIEVRGEGAQALGGDLQSYFPTVGRRLQHADYEEAKDRILALARDDGYLDATFTRNELRVDPAAGTAQALLELDTGKRWFFGAVQIEGDARIDADVIERYLRFKPGEPYSQQKLTDSQFALSDLDYFQDVEVRGRRRRAEGDRIPVLVRAVHSKSRRDDFGIGYGTDTGARVSVGTEFRRFNERGHKLKVALQASQKQSGLSSEYRIPTGHEPGEYWGIAGQASDERLSYGNETKYGLVGSLNRLAGDWDRRYYLKYQRSIFDFDEGEDNAVSVLAPGVTFSRQWLDDPAWAQRGFSLWVDTHAAQKGLLSSATFVQGRVRTKAALPMGKKGRLLGRVEVGATAAREFNKLPPDERFFAGGDQSVRGYAYQSIGSSRDDNGGVIGGRYLNVFSIEAERAVKGDIGAAVFADAGGVGDTPYPTLHYGVGIGVRYRAPFGSLQLDLAHPLDPDEPAVRLHLGVRVGL